jgi:murein L,D-transpeptidase YcbB/YkuD
LQELTHAAAKISVGEELARIDVWLSDAFIAIASDLASGRNSEKRIGTHAVDQDLLTWLSAPGDVRKILESKEPAYPGYMALKKELGSSLDSLSFSSVPDADRLARKIETIRINLDRWRNERVHFADRYVYVNIPSFMLHVVERNTVVFSSRIIVGTMETPTPEITSVIECFTIYPYWTVPRKIAVEEYLPAIQKDTAFLNRNNFDVLDRKGKVLNPDSINWPEFHKNNFPVVLRQREGRENSLGIIKFLFDNPMLFTCMTPMQRSCSKGRRELLAMGVSGWSALSSSLTSWWHRAKESSQSSWKS